ncbi:MAG TPA: hypothetical protein VK832_00630 [Burkholderiaceae bacterium]|nr:hypothetical protein [Burkholderiaceae bacterium]
MPTTTVFKRSIYLFLLTGIFFLAACSPKYNWREVHGKDAPFVVLLPDKPVTATRDINLDGMSLSMTMTAAEVDGVTYAVGYVVLAEDKQTATALNAMKTALVRNINGTVKPSTNSQGQTAAATNDASNIEVSGSRNNGNGSEPLLLLGHFEAKDRRAYQVIVLGNEKAVSREEASTFLTSFKVN